MITWKDLNRPGMGIPIAIIMDYILGIIDIPIYRAYGYITTVVTGTIISIIVGYIYIQLYDFYKNDWLLFEKLKSNTPIKNSEENSFTKFIKKFGKFGAGIIIFAYLTTKDPAITILYFRKGSYKYDGLPTKNIVNLFLASAIATNIFWITILATGFSLWKFIFH